MNSTYRDYEAERYYTCEVTLELNIRVPLPDTFATIADAHIRRAVMLNSGGALAEETMVRGISIAVQRHRRVDLTAMPPPDSVQITLGGPLVDTIHGIGFGGPEGRYDGEWMCPVKLPPSVSSDMREHGYPDAELRPGEWHLFAMYGSE